MIAFVYLRLFFLSFILSIYSSHFIMMVHCRLGLAHYSIVSSPYSPPPQFCANRQFYFCLPPQLCLSYLFEYWSSSLVPVVKVVVENLFTFTDSPFVVLAIVMSVCEWMNVMLQKNSGIVP